MAWYDDLYDKASNLVSKADANELFGVNESGLFNDIGLIDNLKQSALGKALRGVDANTSGAGVNSQGDPMYGSDSDYRPEVEVNQEIEPFQATEYQMNMPAKMQMEYGGQQKRRSPDRVGGSPVETYGKRQRLQLNANTEEEEEMARLAQYLRNRG